MLKKALILIVVFVMLLIALTGCVPGDGTYTFYYWISIKRYPIFCVFH